MKKYFFLFCIVISQIAQGQNAQTVLLETWRTTHWQNSMKYSYTYDENDYLLNHLILSYDTIAGNWINSSQVNYTNNPDGTINFYIGQNWVSQDNDWINTNRATYTYHAYQKPAEILFETWSSGIWKNNMLYIYSYDGNDFLVQILMKTWDQANNSWKNFAQYYYTNNGDGTVHDYLFLVYSSGSWLNSSRGTYSYSATQKLLTTLIENYSGNTWVNSMQLSYSYDASDYLIHNLTEIWSQNTDSWNNFSQTDYDNNDDGSMNLYVVQNWNNSTWINQTRATYTYFPPNGSEEIAGLPVLLYPNPAINSFYLEKLADLPSTRMIVSDLSGKVCLTGIYSAQKNLVDIDDLQPGFYNVMIESGSLVVVRKLIKY